MKIEFAFGITWHGVDNVRGDKRPQIVQETPHTFELIFLRDDFKSIFRFVVHDTRETDQAWVLALPHCQSTAEWH